MVANGHYRIIPLQVLRLFCEGKYCFECGIFACDVTVHFNSLFSVMKQLSMITVEVFVFPKKIIF